MDNVKAPFGGTISKSNDGKSVFVTSTNNLVKYEKLKLNDKLKLTTTNTFVSKGDPIGEKEPNFVETYYKKSGNTWVPDSGNKPDNTNTSDKDTQSTTDKEFANQVIGTGIKIGLPGLAIASDILTEELKKMRKLINF